MIEVDTWTEETTFCCDHCGVTLPDQWVEELGFDEWGDHWCEDCGCVDCGDVAAQVGDPRTRESVCLACFAKRRQPLEVECIQYGTFPEVETWVMYGAARVALYITPTYAEGWHKWETDGRLEIERLKTQALLGYALKPPRKAAIDHYRKTVARKWRQHAEALEG